MKTLSRIAHFPRRNSQKAVDIYSASRNLTKLPAPLTNRQVGWTDEKVSCCRTSILYGNTHHLVTSHQSIIFLHGSDSGNGDYCHFPGEHLVEVGGNGYAPGPGGKTAMAFIVAVVPLGTFFFDRSLRNPIGQ